MLTRKNGSLVEPRDLWVLLFFLAVSVGYLRDPLLRGKSFAIDNTSRYLPWKESGSFDPAYQNNGGTDGTLTFYPRRFYSHKLLSEGEIPLWTPYLLGGLPFMADPHTAIWYPPNVLYAFLEPETALKLLACLQLFLAGSFMYFLLREWGLVRWAALFGGVLFMFNPFFVTHFVNPTNVDAGLWLPLMMLLFDLALRKNFLFYAMLLAGAVACTLLGGFPQISLLAIYALGFYSLVRAAMEWRAAGWRAARRAVAVMLVAVPMGTAFTSVQMLAIADFSRHSARVKLPYEEFEAVFIPPETLLMFAAPQFFGPFTKNWYGLFARAVAPGDQKGAFWQNSFLENNGYLGVLPLLLAALGLYHARASPLMWTGAAVAALALSMTMGSPLFKLAYHYLPGFTFSRICRILYLYGFGLAIVASFGLDAVLTRRREVRRSYAFPLLVGLAAPTIVVLGTLVLQLNFRRADALKDMKRLGQRIEHAEDPLENRLNAYQLAFRRILWNFDTWAPSIVFFAGGTALGLFALAAYLAGWLGATPLAAILAGFTILDFCRYGAEYLTFQDFFFEKRVPPSLEFLRKDPDAFRILRYGEFREVLPPNSPMVFGIRDALGSNALLKERYGRFIALADKGMYVGHKKVIPVRRLGSIKSRVFDMMNVKYFLAADYIPIRYPVNPWDPPDDKNVELVYDGQDVKIYKNTDVLPRVRIVPEAEAVDGLEAAEKALADPKFDPEALLVLENAPEYADWRGSRGASEARIVSLEDTRVRVEATLEDRGFLLLADSYYPGWRARVDGAPGTLLQANLTFMAVPLEKGRHSIEFFYDPTYFRLGAFASLASAVVALTLLGSAYARGGLRGALARTRAPRGA